MKVEFVTDSIEELEELEDETEEVGEGRVVLLHRCKGTRRNRLKWLNKMVAFRVLNGINHLPLNEVACENINKAQEAQCNRSMQSNYATL